MESKRSLRNKEFSNFVTIGGQRTQQDVLSVSSWTSKNQQTQGVVTRYRSGSVTQTHLHPKSLGTFTHTNRKGKKLEITQSDMNADTKELVRNIHSGKFP